MDTWKTLADDLTIQKTIVALKAHNIDAIVVESAQEALQKILKIIPPGAEVMTMSSVTLETIGAVDALNVSGTYDAVKPKLMAMDRTTQSREMQKLGAAPDWAVGSVHAVTEDGHVIIASNTGSQLAAYVYGAGHVLWVVGTQKIVPTLEDGLKRLREYVVPLEDDHMHTLHNVGTHLNKLLIFEGGEFRPGRTTVLFVKEILGF